MKSTLAYSEILFGTDRTPRITAMEHVAAKEKDHVLFWQRNTELTKRQEDFTCFCLCSESIPETCMGNTAYRRLDGSGVLNIMVTSHHWTDMLACVKEIKVHCKSNGLKPDEHVFFINDPVQQHLLLSGKTLFKDMAFHELHRMQLDIETYCDPQYDFCNASRDSDRILLITLSDQSEWVHIISSETMSEKQMLEEMVSVIRERDPDVIEGHNLFNFDLPYIMERAKKNKVKCSIGRDCSVPKSRSSRWSAAERTTHFTRFDIFGRHVIDTYFLVQLYDITHRSLESYSLKNAAIHFGVSPENRTYIEGSLIAETFTCDPEKVTRYAIDDIIETRRLAAILSPTYFAQTQLLPLSYQNVVLRGNATKINALMLRSYLKEQAAVPIPQPSHPFEGGYTDMFYEGLAHRVEHVDVRSLYPSLMLAYNLVPASDTRQIFSGILEQLRTFRLQCKQAEASARTPEEALHFNALQTTFKILINSFYGYLAFEQGLFNDYDVAETITSKGRTLLRSMIDRVNELGGKPIEIDTDGIYFIPPDAELCDEATFRSRFREILPSGIEVEFDGSYQAMFSYKMKNYALLDTDNHVIIKGAALKSRGLEPFQRTLLKNMLRLLLEDRANDIPPLVDAMAEQIRQRSYPISMLAKTETLQSDPASYQSKQTNGQRNKNAAYELALAYPGKYRAGDQISYYITGTNKKVKVFEAARPIHEYNPAQPDDNTEYYIDKLTTLYHKFCPQDIIRNHEKKNEDQQLMLF